MAPMNYQNLNCSSNYGPDVASRVNVLASCYVVDSAASLKGLHYCTTGATGMLKPNHVHHHASDSPLQGRSGIPEVPTSGLPSPPTSPPLAALTSSNKLALLPKNRKRDSPGHRLERRGGAALVIREECERFFCESMKTVFLEHVISKALHGAADPDAPGLEVDAWMEVWDYAGGASFRAFAVNDGQEKTLFVFFDIQGVMERDLKKALMALIELADGPLDCSHIVTCIDRRLPAQEAHELTKSLQWVGFDMATLDKWAHDLDVTSKNWVFMGMEL